MAEYSFVPAGLAQQSSKAGTSWHPPPSAAAAWASPLFYLPQPRVCTALTAIAGTPRQERETEGGSVEMSGGAGEAGSQEGACVDTVNHTEAEMPPAQVPSAQFSSNLYFTVTHSCLN